MVDSVTVWLDSTTFGAAVRSLGAGEESIWQAPEGAAMIACFETSPADRAYLTLAIVGYHDTNHVVTAEIDRARPRVKFSRCAPLGFPASRLRTTTGLRLDQPRDEVERLLGPPRKVREDVAQYAIAPGAPHDSAQATGGAEPKDRTVYVVLTYRNGVLAGVSVSRGNEIVSEANQE